MKKTYLAAFLASLLAPVIASGAGLSDKMTVGGGTLASAGPIAFAPEGILLAADPKSATIVAIATGDVTAAAGSPYALDKVDEKIAERLGTKPSEMTIVDMAANPISHTVYLSVARGRGAEATPVLLQIKPDGAISEVNVKGLPTSVAKIPNAIEDRPVTGRGPSRNDSITDLAFFEGKVYIAGLSNEEFSSNFRAISFPFSDVSKGTSVEMFHGNHGRVETNSPIRTFAAFDIGGQSHLIAAYQCTPLVKIPIKDLEVGKKITGTTVAEMGAGNRPLDMFVYKKDGKNYVLMSNNVLGVTKVSTDGIDSVAPITSRVGGTAGLKYDKIDSLKGTEQLDRLNDNQAVVLMKSPEGTTMLKSVDLP